MKKISRQGGCHDASPRAGAAAFTLVELLVVIAIIALLVGMLAPSLGAAKEYGRGALCLTNLRQMAVAAQTYAACNRDYYPPAYFYSPDWKVSYAWDYVVRKDAGSVAGVTVEPGLLWQGEGPDMRIHQCPSFRGASNSAGDPYTGYNYNTSYIGHGQYESIPSPARVEDVKAPGQCALFGDGQYSAGANKFMRAPRSNPGDAQFSDSFRYSGTQGYRHLNRTNVAFCDGHATAWGQRHTANLSDVAEGTGFLSGDNAMYDTE